MTNTKECHRSEILHGTGILLQKVYRRILKNCIPNYIFAKESCEVRMDFGLHKEFSTLEEFVDQCTNTTY
jgi:hypothetical protein